MTAYDRILRLYARQAELQAAAGVGCYLPETHAAELRAIDASLDQLWHLRRCEMHSAQTTEPETFKTDRRGLASIAAKTDPPGKIAQRKARQRQGAVLVSVENE